MYPSPTFRGRIGSKSEILISDAPHLSRLFWGTKRCILFVAIVLKEWWIQGKPSGHNFPNTKV